MRKGVLSAFLLALLLIFALSGAVVAEENFTPVRISTQAEPQTITSPQTVAVTIKVVNSGEGDIQTPITIMDPDGNQVTQWGSLGVGQSQSWKGSWNVTQAELDAGRLRFSVQYTSYDDDGNAVPTTSTASVTIQKESAAPGLTATYTITPQTPQAGQEVVLRYTLSNTGNVDLTNIRITNTGIDQKNINIASLGVGEKITREYSLTMGSKNLTSNPKVTYQETGSSNVLTYDKMARRTIEVMEGGLELSLKSNATGDARPGDTVTLTVVVKNTSNQTFSKVTVKEAKLGTLEEDKDLKAGEEIEIVKDVVVEDSAEYVFTVTGMSEAGSEVEITPDALSIGMLDMSKVVNLEVIADTEQMVIHEEPAEVRFAVTVKNIGALDGAKLQVKHGKTTIATIDSLPAGEEVTIVKDYLVTMAGKFEFSVVIPEVKAAAGIEAQDEIIYNSNPLQVAYAAPTPIPVTPPPATPEPIVPEEVDPEVDETKTQGGGFNIVPILLRIVAVILVLALLVVVALIIISRRTQVSQSKIIDSYERPNSRAYRAEGRSRRRASQEADEAPVYKKDLDDLMDEADVENPFANKAKKAPIDHDAYRRPDDGAVRADHGATVKIDRETVEQIRREVARKEAERERSFGQTGKYDMSTLRDVPMAGEEREHSRRRHHEDDE